MKCDKCDQEFPQVPANIRRVASLVHSLCIALREQGLPYEYRGPLWDKADSIRQRLPLEVRFCPEVDLYRQLLKDIV